MTKKIVLSALIAAIAGGAIAQSKIIAHRGYWKIDGAGQNSITALQKACQTGVYGSEFDVLQTADGVLVVNHDDTAGKEKMRIEDAPYSQIKDIRLSNGETLPTLEAYLEEGKKCPATQLILELKKHSTQEKEDRAVADIVRMVRDKGIEAQVEYISFSLNVYREFRRLAPEAPVYYLNGDPSPEQIKGEGFTGIDYHYKVMQTHPEWFEQAHKIGLKVNVWTVDEQNPVRFLSDNGADFITTDIPAEAISLLQPNAL